MNYEERYVKAQQAQTCKTKHYCYRAEPSRQDRTSADRGSSIRYGRKDK